MNLFPATLAMCIIIYIGIAKNKKYQKIYQFCHSFDIFCSNLYSGIKFSQKKIFDMIKQSDSSSEFKNFLNIYREYYYNNDINFMQDWKLNQSLLTQEFSTVIINFFYNLGRMDEETQLKEIEKMRERLQQEIINSKEDWKNKGVVSSKLGIMGGLALFVIII